MLSFSGSKHLNRRVLRFEKQAGRTDQTSKQQAELLDKCNGLYRRILAWRKSQVVHQPNLVTLIASATEEGGDSAVSEPESIPLYLPHTVIAEHKLRVRPKVADVERRLREAQADDALSEIRRLRRIITGLWQFKSLQLSGEGNKPNTRLRMTHTRLQNRIKRSAERYRAARSALQHLDPNGPWSTRLQVLEDTHIRGPGREDGESNSNYDISWIWLVARPAGESNSDKMGAKDVAESMKVEWAKTRARKLRWDEEYQLVQEEMRRTIVYLRWKAEWWRGQVDARADAEAHLLSGLNAYAHKQAAMLDRLATRFCCSWAPSLLKIGVAIPAGWPPVPKKDAKPKTKGKEKMTAARQEQGDDDSDTDSESGSGDESDSDSDDGGGEDDMDISDDEGMGDNVSEQERGGKEVGKGGGRGEAGLEYTAGLDDSEDEFDDFDLGL